MSAAFNEIVEPSKRVDVLAETSDRPGVKGWIETFLRRFRQFGFIVLILPLGALVAMCMGVSLAPGLYLFHQVDQWTAEWFSLWRYLTLGVSIGLGFFLYALTLIFVVPLVNFLLPLKVKPFRGN